MAQKKCIVTHACLVEGKHTEPGTVVTLEERDAKNLWASKRGAPYSDNLAQSFKKPSSAASK